METSDASNAGAGYLAGIRKAATMASADGEATADLLVQISGETEPRTFALRGDVVTIGRLPANDVRLELPWISAHQLTLRRISVGWQLEPAPSATRPVTHQGDVVSAPVRLQSVDYFRLTGVEPGDMATCIIVVRDVPGQLASEGSMAASDGEVVTIGSAPGSMIGAGDTTLAAHHVEMVFRDSAWRLNLIDGGQVSVNSSPGTPGQQLSDGDTIAAGGLRLSTKNGTIAWRNVASPWVMNRRRSRSIPSDLWERVRGEGGVLLEALHLRRDLKKASLLDDLSLRVRPRQLVAIVGMSGAGKSTLLNALSGYRAPTSGEVRIDGVSLYENLDYFRSFVGFVPQKDIVHGKLTVEEALVYSARLRLPGVTSDEQAERVNEVLDALGLRDRRDVLIEQLSGGQVKRVSIGVELISRPQLLFLDEPTSGLDPVTETGLMHLLRRLADQGRTVVLITHATKNVMLADNVLFMVPGGRVAWYGSPSEAISYFDRQRSEIERGDRALEFDEIFELLEDKDRGTPQDWSARYLANPVYEEQIRRPLRLDGPTAPGRAPASRAKRPSFLQQFIALSARNLKLIGRDRFALILMLAAAPLLAGLDFLITERNMFDSLAGDTARIITNTNTLIVNAMLVGALGQMREIIKDREIYRRERLVNLRIAPYILSKVWIAGLIAVYQAAWWVGIRYLAVDMPGGIDNAASIYITVVLVIFAGMMLGLFASAVAPSEDAVALIVALLIIPQVLFSGAHLPAHKLDPMVRAQMDIMPSRWAFEAILTESGHGKDVANDACWQLPEEDRRMLTSEQKAGCTCMGENVFDTCEFPGIQRYEGSASSAVEVGITEDAARSQAVAAAEGRIALENEYYGRVWDINVVSRWAALLAISGALIGIIILLQRFRGRYG